MSGTEVLAPNAFEMIVTLGSIIAAILFVWAVASLSRHRKALSIGESWLWLVAIFCLPLLGSVIWLATARRLIRQGQDRSVAG